jgi:hypothetical protein
VQYNHNNGSHARKAHTPKNPSNIPTTIESESDQSKESPSAIKKAKSAALTIVKGCAP